MKLRGFLYVVFAAMLWGLSGTVAKYLFNQAVNPLVLVEIRLTSAAAILGLVLLLVSRQSLLVRRKDMLYLAFLGIFGVAGVQFAYFFTISQTNVATAIFLQYTSPVMVALYAVFFQREKLGMAKLACLIITVAGSYLMVFSRGLTVTSAGLASGLLSAVFVTIYTVFSKRALAAYSPWTVLFYCFAVGAVAGALIVPPWSYPAGTFGSTNLLFFLYFALFATVVPFGCYFIGLKYLQPTTVGITSTLEPVIAAFTAFLLLNERLSLSQVAGALLVLMAVVLLQMVGHSQPVQSNPQQAT